MSKIPASTALGQRAPLRIAEVAPSDQADVVIVAAPPRPLIPPGTYDAVGAKYQQAWIGRALKLVVLYDVIVPDPTSEYGTRNVRLGRFYPMQKLPDGRLKAPRNGEYAREWTLVADRRISRHDRPNPDVFIEVLVSVEVVTVETNRFHRPLPPHARYSKVAFIREVKAGRCRR
jgi:hypothetical protein